MLKRAPFVLSPSGRTRKRRLRNSRGAIRVKVLLQLNSLPCSVKKTITQLLSMKNILILAALLCAVNLHAISTDSTTPVYGTGGFRDPVYTIDRSERWLGGSDLSTALTVAESFSLQNNSVLSKVELWSYDTVDGSGGTLKELRYAIYTGATQPTGAPVASGLGKILSSDGIGHVSPTDGTLASIDGKLFV